MTGTGYQINTLAGKFSLTNLLFVSEINEINTSYRGCALLMRL
jgi:hypothetical protein